MTISQWRLVSETLESIGEDLEGEIEGFVYMTLLGQDVLWPLWRLRGVEFISMIRLLQGEDMGSHHLRTTSLSWKADVS